MNLKLAEYNLKDGKFLRFLELDGKYNKNLGFLLAKDYIHIQDHQTIATSIVSQYHHLDKTDPLKRFDGLFDGLTYGEGRFILIINNDKLIIEAVNNS